MPQASKKSMDPVLARAWILWRKQDIKQIKQVAVDNLIRDTLWAELPESYDEISISGYRQKIYEYVYTRYPDVAQHRMINLRRNHGAI